MEKDVFEILADRLIEVIDRHLPKEELIKETRRIAEAAAVMNEVNGINYNTELTEALTRLGKSRDSSDGKVNEVINSLVEWG